MSDPSFAFVLKLRSFMAHPPQQGALVQPVPIRARPVHFDIPNRGSEHQGTRKAGSRSLGGFIDRQAEPTGTLNPDWGRVLPTGSFHLAPQVYAHHIQSLPPN